VPADVEPIQRGVSVPASKQIKVATLIELFSIVFLSIR
jgi:hypothetical protein